MPRLLFVVNHPRWFVTHRLHLAERARLEGYEVHVASPHGKDVEIIQGRGFPWHGFVLNRGGRNPIQELRTLLELRSLYKQLSPDIVHHVTLKLVIHGTAAARLARVPCIVNAIAGLGHVFGSRSIGDRITRFILVASLRLLVRHHRMVHILQNNDDLDSLVNARAILREQAVLIRGAGVDIDHFSAAPREGHLVPTVVFVGRLLYTKGIVEFIDAAKELSRRGVRARFVVAGDFDYENPAHVAEKELASWTSDGIVKYAGYLDDMAAFLREADIVCYPSYYPEGVPKVLIEAAASGLPIVTTNMPGCRDVVEHNRSGFLVEPRDVGALVSALTPLIANPALRSSMGEVGRLRAASGFSLTSVADATLRIYHQLLIAPPQKGPSQ